MKLGFLHREPKFQPDWEQVVVMSGDLACTEAERDQWKRIAETALARAGRLQTERDCLVAERHRNRIEWERVFMFQRDQLEKAHLLIQGVSNQWMTAYLTEGSTDG